MFVTTSSTTGTSYIIKQKVNDLFQGFELVPEYIEEVLIIKKDDYAEYL